MDDKESLGIRIFHTIWKSIIVIAIIYFIMTEYVLYLYLKDHYKTTTGTIVGTETFSDGGIAYRYEYYINGVEYSQTGIGRDDRYPPTIGEKYTVKYLEFMPSIASGQF